MKHLSGVIILGLCLLSCKKAPALPKFGDAAGASADDSSAQASGDGSTDDGSDSTDAGDGTDTTDAGAGDTTATATPDVLTAWSGDTSLGTTGKGFIMTKSPIKLETTDKAIIGGQKTTKGPTITVDDIDEAMKLINGYKDATAPTGASACDASKLLGDRYLQLKTGATVVQIGTNTGKCTAQRYIDAKDFEKFMLWFNNTFGDPTATSTTAPGTSTGVNFNLLLKH